MLIHLIRHTTPEIDEGTCYGQTDLDLAPSFEQEAQAVLSKLEPRYDCVITSPLQRCSRLANKIHTDKRLSDERIVEYNFGDWELKKWSEFTCDATQRWMDNFVEQAAPNGDSLISMKSRVDDFWQELIDSNHKRVAVVTHSGVQRLIHGLVLDTPMSHLFRLQLDFGAVLELNVDNENDLTTIKHC